LVTTKSVLTRTFLGETSIPTAVVDQGITRFRRGVVHLGDDDVVIAVIGHLANCPFDVRVGSF
jgi:hypothetical protein